MKERLQKVMASAGVASRRQCEELILQGVVRVNGKVVDELPVFADPENDQITVSGRRLKSPERVYFLVNKPKGVICTSHDPQGRPSAVSLVPTSERVFCVGRLDVDTMGLLILTNDSELTNLLTHPRYKVPKTYVARVSGHLDDAAVERLRKGVYLAEGKTGQATVKVLHNGREESHIEITIRQGLNRQVRRMLASVGLSVDSLRRTRIGNLKIEGLGVGQYRPLTRSEVEYLRRTATERPGAPIAEKQHKVRRKPVGERVHRESRRRPDRSGGRGGRRPR
jgi:23S rRNA pseudouridine2605 synthase